MKSKAIKFLEEYSDEELQVDKVSEIPKNFEGYLWIGDDYCITFLDKDAPSGRVIQRIKSAYQYEQDPNDTI